MSMPVGSDFNAFRSPLQTTGQSVLMGYQENKIQQLAAALPSNSIHITNARDTMYKVNNFVQQIAMDTRSKFGNMNPEGVYYPIFDRDMILNLTNTMKGCIMLHPKVAKLNETQGVSGFKGMYNAIEPEISVLEDKDFYKELHNGQVQYVDSDDEDDDTEYEVCVMEVGVDYLSDIDRYSIEETYELVDNMLRDGIDPTSDTGEEL